MKTNILAIFAMAAVISGTISCSRGDDNNATTAGKDDNVLVIQLPDNVAPARSVEAQVATGTSTTLSDVQVFLLNSSNIVLIHDTFSGQEMTDKKKRMEQVPSAVSKVVVIANAPAGAERTAVAALTSYSALMTYPFTVAGQNAGAGVDSKTLRGEGAPATATDPAPDGHDYKKADVTLNAITGRFEIGAVKAGTGITSVTLDGVWINQYYNDGSLPTPVVFNDSNASCWNTTPDPKTASPQSTPFTTVSTIPAYTSPAYYTAANNASVTLSAASQVYAFHVFSGANVPHLILLVHGEYATSDANRYFLGWVTFRKFMDAGTAISSILPNTIYKVGTGITGITINADEITERPEMDNIDLGIDVTITPWTEKIVTPSVN